MQQTPNNIKTPQETDSSKDVDLVDLRELAVAVWSFRYWISSFQR